MEIEDVRRVAQRIVEVRGRDYRLSPEDREDLLQELLIRYIGAWTEGAEPDNVEAWLETACGRVITDRWRAEQRRVKRAEPLVGENGPYDVVADIIEKARSRQASMPAVGDALIQQIFGLITDEDAQMLQRRFVDDDSAADIAAALGISRASVNQRVARAKVRLRDAMGARPDLAVELRADHPKAY